LYFGDEVHALASIQMPPLKRREVPVLGKREEKEERSGRGREKEGNILVSESFPEYDTCNES